MSNKILCFLTATSISLTALSASAQGGNLKKQNWSGNDQMRRAVPGMSILGGGPKPVDVVTPVKHVESVSSTNINSNALKQEAEKAYQEGMTWERKGNLAAALEAMRRSLKIREASFASSDARIPEVKEKIADLLAAKGMSKEALEMYSNALFSYGKFNGPGTAHRIRPLTSMGSIQLKELNYKGACDCYNQAFMLTQNNKGIASPEAMRLRLQLASTFHAAKSYDLAASLYNECFDLQRKNPKLIDHDKLISSMQDYVSVLKELKRDEEANKFLAQVKVLQGGGDPASATDQAAKLPEDVEAPSAKPAADPAATKPAAEVSSTQPTPGSQSK